MTTVYTTVYCFSPLQYHGVNVLRITLTIFLTFGRVIHIYSLVYSGGHLICSGGHLICSGGQLICSGGHLICSGGHLIYPGGHLITATSTAPAPCCCTPYCCTPCCSGGHLVCSGGHHVCSGNHHVCGGYDDAILRVFLTHWSFSLDCYTRFGLET
jgi:hypothetical protein